MKNQKSACAFSCVPVARSCKFRSPCSVQCKSCDHRKETYISNEVDKQSSPQGMIPFEVNLCCLCFPELWLWSHRSSKVMVCFVWCLLMNFHALAPKRYKKSVVSGFVHRIFRACSSWNNFQDGLERAKSILEKNQYPPNFTTRSSKTLQKNYYHQLQQL